MGNSLMSSEWKQISHAAELRNNVSALNFQILCLIAFHIVNFSMETEKLLQYPSGENLLLRKILW